MPLPLSPDLHRRFSDLIASGFSARSAARRLLIPPASGVRLAAKVREGASLEPGKCGRPAGVGKLGPHKDFLVELVEQDPDITLAELRGALIDAEDVTVGIPAIFRMLQRLGFTYKKRHWWPPRGRGRTTQDPRSSCPRRMDKAPHSGNARSS